MMAHGGSSSEWDCPSTNGMVARLRNVTQEIPGIALFNSSLFSDETGILKTKYMLISSYK